MSTLAATLARAWRAPVGLVVSSRVPRKTFAVPRRAAFRVSASAADADAPRPKSGKKPVPPPHFLRPPDPPPSVDAWQNMVLLMDKPQDWTSFDVVGKTRSMSRKFGSKKVGHCGTLDPMATGLLILCVGKATKLVESFTGMDKCYTGTMRLGESTPSQDAATEPDETFPWEHITDEDLAEGAAAMTGEITQIPPMYSAIKVKGERLYKAARRGETVERKPRHCVINAFEVTRDPHDARSVHFRVDCSKGTYVRTLAHDLGRRLGSGAHLTALRRESIGEYDVRDAWTVDALFEACGPMLEEHLAKQEANGNGNGDGGKNANANAKSRANAKAKTGPSSGGDDAFVALPGYETTIRTVREGTSGAATVAAEDVVTVHATGTVEQTMQKFWSTKDEGQRPFTYQAGVGGVITGWDQGCLGMRVGEVREIRIPADEGYGQGGFPAWGIPPGGTLLFEIEVLSVEGE